MAFDFLDQRRVPSFNFPMRRATPGATAIAERSATRWPRPVPAYLFTSPCPSLHAAKLRTEIATRHYSGQLSESSDTQDYSRQYSVSPRRYSSQDRTQNLQDTTQTTATDKFIENARWLGGRGPGCSGYRALRLRPQTSIKPSLLGRTEWPWPRSAAQTRTTSVGSTRASQ